MGRSTYLVALGSNRVGRHGRPQGEVAAALRLLGGQASPIVNSAPLGPSTRTFANAAVLIDTDEVPVDLLARLKRIEQAFGRRTGRRWGARVIDLDIILWSGGRVASRTLTVPHPAFRQRAFVLTPARAIAGAWRDPVTGRRVRHLHTRLTTRRPSRSAREHCWGP